MNGKQLKNSILQWAIQGKLVPQDPNDEPASVLLEKIRTEKARLVKEGKIKKDKNESFIFRGDDNSYYEKFLATGEVKCIDEEIPFEIPQGWEWCRLSLLIYPPKYGTSKKSVPSGLLPVLRMGNIQDGEIVFDKLVYSNDLDDNKKLLLQYGDLLFNRTNSAELVGKTAIFRGQRNAIFAGYLILLRPIFINSEYLNLLLNTPYARDYCNEVKTIGVQQCNINAEKISNLLIPVPNLHETVAIVEKVKNIALPIIKYGEFYQKLKHLNRELPIIIRKSILQEAIQGKLVPQIAEEGTARELLEQIKTEKEKLVREGKLKKSALTDSVIFRGDDNKYYEQVGKKCLDITEQIPFETPKNWVWTRLSHIANIYTGNSISETEKKSKFTDVIGRYYIGTKDVDFNNRIIYDNGIAIPKQYEPDFRLAPNNSILMCIEGGSAGRKIAILNQDVCFGNKLCCFSPFVGIGKYMYYYLQSPSFFELFNLNKTGIIGGVSIAKVKEILIPLPPIKEQQRIVAQIEKLFEQLR
ncbi:restriction endonuclease subunit S [Bacteroides finegoldii]|uniref:Restriction endonuclease subunit S n=5 Tax=cellular organisms TaxID=131567 RepID=A0AB34BRR2_9BACE|nr:restriction endonuclease subunit S [Bacteroides finegoldii]KAA5240677.1 restriction endonuclease subunit S [Bacteroides finegoldii]KAA5254673.1 restriction endonuclease subunit S [Bacteroides finegoldii]KAA5258375.1 restriction endonuclease subunit S [Bacteroides finegoldii]